MKIPPKKPHFFKPLQKGFKHGLKIPTGFLKYLKGQDQIEHVVLRRGGKNWLVKVNGCRFETGWAAFVEEHDLQLGDLLIFRHEGDMEFEVSIFDSSHCNGEYAEYPQEEEGCDNVEETSKNFEFEDAGTHNPCSQSHFECTVKPYCISNGYLRLPKQFAMENGLINKKRGLIIRDERQRSWNLKLATRNSVVHIFGGWAEFRVANDLKEGDYMMFEVIANGEKPIWIFHGKEKKGQSPRGPSFALANSACTPSVPARNQENSWKCEFKDKPNPNVVSTRKSFAKEESATHSSFGAKEESATHSSFGQSHFVCTVRPYCLSRNYLYLPKQFARENGLINKKCGLVIRDERQRSWNLRLNTYTRGVYIGEGWRKFCADNDLKEGDCITFEVVTNGEKPIWRLHDKPNPNVVSTRKAFAKEESAAHSSFGQSHFVCTLRPYCLSRNHLYLPIGFARENGLINKKCGLVIRDERQRSWNLRLNTYDRGVYIGEGWREFCVDNDLKEGDCITFEVVTNGEKPIWKFHGARTHKPFGQSHFVCIVRPYCLVNDFLVIPTKFALANGLTNKRCDLIIRDERERSWNIKLRSSGNSVCIRGGWHEFRDANCLKEGDCIMFEVVSNGNTPIWKYNGAGTHKPHGHSHFVCIVRPHCLINDILVIPTKFALANGLSNKRCDLIIRDETERTWNVKLRSYGNSVCIRGGWNEFRDANCLKEGDCIMFEVVSNGSIPIWKYNGKVSGKDAKHHKKPLTR